jgi:zinc transport system permease protein
MLDDFLIRALLAGLGVALAASPLGCFVIWRRMAYFSDATAHAAILGVALSLALGISVTAGVLAMALAVALALAALTGRGHAADTGLAVIAHAGLALGLVAVAFLPGVRIDLMAYLFGDILAVSAADLAVVWTGAVLVLGLVIWRWQAMLMSTLSPDLAFASGIHPRRESLVLTIALAMLVAVSIKVVGALLIGALLIVPAAAARPLVRTPEAMAIAAAAISAAAVAAGLLASLHFDTPAGPSIVTAAATAFLATTALGAVLRRS